MIDTASDVSVAVTYGFVTQHESLAVRIIAYFMLLLNIPAGKETEFSAVTPVLSLDQLWTLCKHKYAVQIPIMICTIVIQFVLYRAEPLAIGSLVLSVVAIGIITVRFLVQRRHPVPQRLRRGSYASTNAASLRALRAITSDEEGSDKDCALELPALKTAKVPLARGPAADSDSELPSLAFGPVGTITVNPESSNTPSLCQIPPVVASMPAGPRMSRLATLAAPGAASGGAYAFRGPVVLPSARRH